MEVTDGTLRAAKGTVGTFGTATVWRQGQAWARGQRGVPLASASWSGARALSRDRLVVRSSIRRLQRPAHLFDKGGEGSEGAGRGAIVGMASRSGGSVRSVRVFPGGFTCAQRSTVAGVGSRSGGSGRSVFEFRSGLLATIRGRGGANSLLPHGYDRLGRPRQVPAVAVPLDERIRPA